MTSFQCPICNVHHSQPWPHVPTTKWGECGCSDQVTCIHHQVYPDESVPSRPNEGALQTLAKEDAKWRTARWEEKRSKAEWFEQMTKRIEELELEVKRLSQPCYECGGVK